MMQQINLLTEELKHKAQPLPLGHLLAAWAAFGMLLMLVSSWDGATLWRLVSEHEDTEGQWRTLRDANGQLNARLSTEADPSLREEVASLRARQAVQRRLMDLLHGYQSEQTEGFSPYLSDLAEHRVAGMWLQGIMLSQGGERIHLHGKTTNPEVLPKFLKRLSLGESFQGHRFDSFALEENDEGLLEFDITGPEVTGE